MTALYTPDPLAPPGFVLAQRLDAHLAAADAALARDYPGDRGVRQPVHTVYVPADRFDAGTVPAWGAQARAVLDEFGGTATELASATQLDEQWVLAGYDRVRAKLATEPIEDLRIDFEDGYGARPAAEEDDAAVAAAAALRAAVEAGTAPPFVGIRFKSFEAPTRRRGLRTLRLFLAELGPLPSGFVLTLPKVTSVDQVEAMVLACTALEVDLALPEDSLRFEIQVETPQAVLGADGRALIAPMIHAGAGRVTALHYGTYDYSASAGISAQDQSMEHPAADHAKAVMQVAAAGTGVHLSDGSTNIVPVGDADAVRAAWALHARLVGRSLHRGYYQGWDLHPAQLPTRFAATYAFYLAGLPQACARLRAYVERQSSGFMDEPATAVALAGFLLRAVDCGAVDDAEVTERTGLHRATLDVLARRTGTTS